MRSTTRNGLARWALPALLSLLTLPAPTAWSRGSAPHVVPHGGTSHSAPAHESPRPGHAGQGAATDAPPWRDPADTAPLLYASQAQAQAEQAAQAGAGKGPHTVRPFLAAPFVEVRLTGVPEVDRRLLRRIADDLSAGIDPDRIKAASLADDALTDEALARGLSHDPTGPEATVVQALRRLGPNPQADALEAALAPLQGQILLLLVHHDVGRRAVVFQGLDGKPVRIDLDTLGAAASAIGVHLQLQGCRVGQASSAGMVDDLNSLQGAQAIVRALRGRPSSWLDLFAGLSSQDHVFRIDPAVWQDERLVEIYAGSSGPRLSAIQWLGVRAGSAAVPPPAPVQFQAGSDPFKALRVATTPWLAAGVALSLLLGGLAVPWTRSAGQAVTRWGMFDLLAHALVLALWFTLFRVAVEGAAWWPWVGAGLLALLALLGATGLSQPGAARWLAALQTARSVLLLLPFAALVLMQRNAWAPDGTALTALRGLHAWSVGHDTFKHIASMAAMVGLLFYVPAVCNIALGEWLVRVWRRRGPRQHWVAQLRDMGVQDTRLLRATVRTRGVLERALELRLGGPPSWAALVSQARFTAADPWRARPAADWHLATLPLPGVPQAGQIWGLVRQDHPFFHGLPLVLVQRWQAGQLPIADLPASALAVQAGTRADDFTEAKPATDGMPFMCGLLVVGALALAALTPWAAQEGMQAMTLGAASLPAAGAALLGRAIWRVRRRHRQLLGARPSGV